MLKKASVLACAAVSAAGIAATPANAAGSTSQLYIHGTAKMASFTSYGECQSHSSWQVRNVASHGGKIVTGDDVARTKCFPVANGRWSYLTAYTAPKAISKGDYTLSQSATRGDTFWLFQHSVSGSASSFTQAKCEANRNAFDQKVIAGLHVRYIKSPACGINSSSKTRSYVASYLGTSKTSGLAGDHVNQYSTSVLTEAVMLGYSIPGAA